LKNYKFYEYLLVIFKYHDGSLFSRYSVLNTKLSTTILLVTEKISIAVLILPTTKLSKLIAQHSHKCANTSFGTFYLLNYLERSYFLKT